MENWQIYTLMGVIAALILGKYLVDYYHEVTKRNRYLEAQIKLLAIIAGKLDANIDKVSEIVTDARIPKQDSDYKKEEAKRLLGKS